MDTKPIENLLRALWKSQDWGGTYIGECMEAVDDLVPKIAALDHLCAKLLRPLLDALRNAADLDAQAIYDLLADTGIVRREIYQPGQSEHAMFTDTDVTWPCEAEPGEEIWVLTELGKRFSGHGVTTPEEPR